MEFFAENTAHRSALGSLWNWTLGSLVLVLAWDAGGLDLPLARWAASGVHGFAARDNWFTGALLHDAARQLAFATGAWLLIGIWWPSGVLRRLGRPARIQWFA